MDRSPGKKKSKEMENPPSARWRGDAVLREPILVDVGRGSGRRSGSSRSVDPVLIDVDLLRLDTISGLKTCQAYTLGGKSIAARRKGD
jgi:hypothetical protein